jgi:outer membrane protein
MKNVLLVVNIVLVIAVGTLFFLYFSKTPSKIGAAVVSESAGERGNSEFRVAYFEMDSVENNYIYAQEIRGMFKEKERKLNEELDNIKNRYNQLWEESSQMQSNLSDEEKNKRKIALDQMAENYKNRQQVAGQELQGEAFRFKFEIHKQIKDFLKQYSKDKGYTYIFVSGGTEGVDFMFYKDTAYDITADLLKSLNESYRAKKKNK